MIDIVVPQHRSESDSTFENIAEQCKTLSKRLADLEIRFHKESSLGAILRKAMSTGDAWVKRELVWNNRDVINAAYAQRITKAMLSAIDDPGALECLRRIASKQIGSLDREQSHGKNALWELELAEKLKSDGFQVRHDEPDLQVRLSFGSYGIACKKIYSEKGVEAHIRKGAEQIKRAGLYGIVALNIDELLPKDAVIVGSTTDSISLYVERFQNDFLSRNERKLRKFIDDGRIDGIWLSTHVFAPLKSHHSSLTNHFQNLLWSVGNLNLEQMNRFSELHQRKKSKNS
jgi:hypothetical protein